MENIGNNSTVSVLSVIILALLAVLVYVLYNRNKGMRGLTAPDSELSPDLKPVPLPTGQVRLEAKQVLEAALVKSGLNPANWDTDRVAIYPDSTSLAKVQFYAAPTQTNYEKFVDGLIAGVILDVGNSYVPSKSSEQRTPQGNVYRVRVRTNAIEIINAQSEPISVRRDVLFIARRQGHQASALAFREGSCYLGGCIGDRCFYLYCTAD